jgi:hypothetical protein
MFHATAPLDNDACPCLTFHNLLQVLNLSPKPPVSFDGKRSTEGPVKQTGQVLRNSRFIVVDTNETVSRALPSCGRSDRIQPAEISFVSA